MDLISHAQFKKTWASRPESNETNVEQMVAIFLYLKELISNADKAGGGTIMTPPAGTTKNIYDQLPKIASEYLVRYAPPLTATKEIRREKDRQRKAAHRKKHRISCTCGKTVAMKDLSRHKKSKTCIARTNEKKNAEDFADNCVEGTH